MNKYLVILLSLLFPCVLLAQNKGIRVVDNKGTIIYVDPSKWFQEGSNLFNKNTNGNVAIGLDPLSLTPVSSRLYITNAFDPSVPVLKLDTPSVGALTDSVLTWDPSDFSVRKIAISKLSPNDWHVLGNAGTDPATNFLGTTDDKSLIFKINNQVSGMLTSPTNGANTSFGYLSLMNPDVENGGISNSAFGVGALLSNTTGTNNTAMGTTALQNNITGKTNVAIGNNALASNVTGSDNTSIGTSALYAVQNGSRNTGVGLSAGYNLLGDYNTLIGYKSGFHIASGSSNIVIGANSTGDISSSAPTASNELNIGNTLFGTGINGAAGGTAGKIGVNVQNPDVELDVNGQVKVRTLPAGATTDNLVTADASGNLRQTAANTIGWLLKGNGSTNPANNFVGTTDNQPLLFKVNSVQSGMISILGAGGTTGGNTGFGNKSLFSVTTSSYGNSAVGQEALSLINNGGDNTAIGFRALSNSANGVANTAVGSSALGSYTGSNCSTCGRNTAVGYLSMAGGGSLANNNGNYNTALGISSMSNSGIPISGNYNLALGANALTNSGPASYNTAVGPNTLKAILTSTANYNVAVGSSALVALTTGNSNVAVGNNAGALLTTGASNILIGGSLTNFVNASNVGVSNEMNIGNALYGKNINGTLNSTTGAIGINTNNPGTSLDVNGQVTVRTLSAGSATDNVVTADATGILHTMSMSSVGGTAWYKTSTTTDAGNDKISNIYRTGFVGITDGTSFAPTAGLHIRSANAVGNDIMMEGINDNPAITLANITGTTTNTANGAGLGSIAFAAGIGTGARTTLVNISSYYRGDGTTQLADLRFALAGIGERMRIDATGFVGIGANAPITPLDVRGSVRTGSPNIGAIIGTTSFAGGTNAVATGLNSFAYGNGATAGNGTGVAATDYGQVAFGTSTASGLNSFAGGTNSVASATGSFAYGNGATASSGGATPVGYNTAFGGATASANGGYAFAAGVAIASGSYSAAFGSNGTTAAGNSSFATGNKNVIDSGSANSATFGVNNSIFSTVSNTIVANPGYANLAAGNGNKIYSQNSVALGSLNTMNATYLTGGSNFAQSCVALGANNFTDGIAAIAMGSNNKSNGSYSAAIGGANEIGTTSNYSVAIGNGNKIGLTSASAGSFAGGQSNTIDANGSVALGYNATVSADHATAIGAYVSVASGHYGSFVIGDNFSTPVVSTSVNQFTGMFNGGYRFLTNRTDLTKGMTMDALGNVNFSGTVSSAGTVITSDMRLKKDIQTLTGVLNNIKQLRGVNYYWKDASKGTDLQLGMIAQELEKVYPELVVTNKETGFKAVNYAQFTGVLVEGIKEQQTQIDDLKSEVETLKKQIQEIKDLLKK